ncbi:ECF transporter S component [Bifidobacterium samirii]|uniref:Riboflavin transporter n=1 Tax=Bifidobacterium samirii TaxID=2306974 RepID=A0A430FTV6_9BIFI|nr:ECF transporter S component [Bifidobacterium samirii]RSX56381.1 hypothetical protein D2E24_1194 [Bifidobacterium samirii]
MSVSSHTQSPHTSHTSHATGVGDAGRWSTRRIALLAMLTALTMAASFIEFPLIPGVPWLKYDPSGIVCLAAGFVLGPSAAAATSVLGFLPHLFVDPWGTLMAVLVALALSVPAALVHRARPSRRGALIGLLVGGVCALAAAIGGNLIVTPFYAHMTVAQVAALVVPALLPFNVAKIAVHAVVAMLVYRPAVALIGPSRA